MLHDQTYSSGALGDLCKQIANRVDLYPAIVTLLMTASREKHVGIIVITCGLQLVWEKILGRHGFAEIPVIGAARRNGLVVDPNVKGALVDLLRKADNIHVAAFGDSPVDLPMLSKADRAVVVVGDETSRSTRMDIDLFEHMRDGTLKAEQAIVSPGARPRLHDEDAEHPIANLRIIALDNTDFLQRTFHATRASTPLQVMFADENGAAKLLSTPMRDATISGPALRQAHQRTGWFLAMQILPDLLGLEEYDIPHVQGKTTKGHRIKNEANTLIVALMRGGEPMALGVNEALPSASLLHAKTGNYLKVKHLQGMSAIVLVDSVINNGKTMIEFVEHVHDLDSEISIVLVAGVIQANAMTSLESLKQRLVSQRVCLVALRSSDNKYSGRGGTDTGHRLFNTTSLDREVVAEGVRQPIRVERIVCR